MNVQNRFIWTDGDVVVTPPQETTNLNGTRMMGKFSVRDWQEWDLEHPYIPATHQTVLTLSPAAEHRMEKRDWAQWDAEHPYEPVGKIAKVGSATKFTAGALGIPASKMKGDAFTKAANKAQTDIVNNPQTSEAFLHQTFSTEISAAADAHGKGFTNAVSSHLGIASAAEQALKSQDVDPKFYTQVVKHSAGYQAEFRDWADWDAEHPNGWAEADAARSGRTVTPDVESLKGGTAEAHLTSDGTFTDDRQQLHDSIVGYNVDGHAEQPSDDRHMVIMGGGTAAGKSTMVNSGAVDLPNDPVSVNADDIKEMLPETTAAKAAGDDGWAANAHEESSYLAARTTAAAQAQGQNILLDGTGNSNIDKLVGKIDAAHAAGYKADGVYATVPIETALARSQARGEATGRFVPTTAIKEIYNSVGKVVPSAAEKFDTFKLYDTQTTTPKLIADAHGPGTLQVHDSDRWASFTAGKG